MSEMDGPREPGEAASEAHGGVSRRQVLGWALGGVAAVGAAVAVPVAVEQTSSTPSSSAPHAYPRVKVANVADLAGGPVTFEYPLVGQHSMVVDLGRPARHGVGPKASIVGYSLICQHMGCTVTFDPTTTEFICPCHQSRYDPTVDGMVVIGQAPLPLPRVALELDAKGDIYATEVTELIWGYRDNLLNGAQV